MSAASKSHRSLGPRKRRFQKLSLSRPVDRVDVAHPDWRTNAIALLDALQAYPILVEPSRPIRVRVESGLMSDESELVGSLTVMFEEIRSRGFGNAGEEDELNRSWNSFVELLKHRTKLRSHSRSPIRSTENVQTRSSSSISLPAPDEVVSQLSQSLGGCAVDFDLADNDVLTAAAVSATGRKPIQQDRVCLQESKMGLIFGVFDGHGMLGESSAALCARVAPSLIASHVSLSASENGPGEACVSALNTLNETMIELAEHQHGLFQRRQVDLVKLPNHFDYGTTAIVGVVSSTEAGLKLHFAAVGDSRLVVFNSDTSGSFSPVSLTTQHRINQAELDRIGLIDSAGIDLPDSNNFRLFPRHLGSVDKATQAGLALNMSRSLGHRELRHCGVSAQPEQGELLIDKGSNSIIVAASDGVWDQLSTRKVAGILQECRHLSSLELAAEIVKQSDMRWQQMEACDNFGIVCIRLHSEEKRKGTF